MQSLTLNKKGMEVKKKKWGGLGGRVDSLIQYYSAKTIYSVPWNIILHTTNNMPIHVTSGKIHVDFNLKYMHWIKTMHGFWSALCSSCTVFVITLLLLAPEEGSSEELPSLFCSLCILLKRAISILPLEFLE